jgi:hypothetical protein
MNVEENTQNNKAAPGVELRQLALGVDQELLDRFDSDSRAGVPVAARSPWDNWNDWSDTWRDSHRT